MTRGVGFGVFVAIVVAAAVGHAIGMRRGHEHPDLVEAVDWLQTRRWGRALLFVGWAFAGWHFFVR
jgi:hypothetical protein